MKEAPEKIQSYWRTICRRAAEIGGHDPLLAEGMMDPALQLRMTIKDGKKLMAAVDETTQQESITGAIIKTKGKLLTMTAREAVDCGLGAGLAEDLAAISQSAPRLAGWTPVSYRGSEIMKLHALKAKTAEERIKNSLKRAQNEFARAVESDPTAQSYQVLPGGRFTTESKSKWKTLSKRCTDALERCELALQEAFFAGKEFPFLKQEAEEARKTQDKINEIRRKIRAQSQREGI